MKKKLKSQLIIAGVILAVLILGYFYYVSGPEISANGVSSVTAVPDKISININAQGKGTTSQESQENASIVSDNLLKELDNLGIPMEDIELSSYYTYEEKDWETGTSRGFITNQQVIVRISDFSETSKIIRSASKAEALVSGINFELSTDKQNEYKAIALKQASKDARTKADAVAEGFGKGIGKLVSVQSQDFNYYPYPFYAREDSAISSGNVEAEKVAAQLTGISPRDLEVSASVSATYTMTKF